MSLCAAKIAAAKTQTAFLNGESKQSMAAFRRVARLLRQFVRMKKLLVLSAVLLGTAAASQAGGIDIRIGLPLPPLPHVVISAPAPRVIVHEPRVVLRAPVCAPAPVYVPVCAPAPVIVVPPRRVVYAAPYHHHPYHCRY